MAERIAERERIFIGNTSQVNSGSRGDYKWTVSVQDPYEKVASATFTLHPTFQPSEVKLEKAPFQVERVGWGTFPVTIKVVFKGGQTESYTHELVLDPTKLQPATGYLVPGSFDVLPLHQDWLNSGGDAKLALDPDRKLALPRNEIDFQPWFTGTRADKEAIGKSIVRLLATDGFFYLRNHGVPKKLIDDAMAHARDFFSLTQQAKGPMMPVFHQPPSKAAVGYREIRSEALNPKLGGDLKESFDYGLNTDGPKPPGTNFPKISPWPQEGGPSFYNCRPGFKAISMEYLEAAYRVATELLQAICLGLGLEPNAFDGFFENPLVVNRYIRYPPQEPVVYPPMNPFPGFGYPVMPPKPSHGAGSHVDFGALTLIYQTSDGLDVLNHLNQWQTVGTRADTFVVNCGYIMQKLTNDAVRAAKHRVINQQPQDRYSFALFLDPSPTKQIAPHPAFVSESHPAKYEACQSGHKGVIFRAGIEQKGY